MDAKLYGGQTGFAVLRRCHAATLLFQRLRAVQNVGRESIQDPALIQAIKLSVIPVKVNVDNTPELAKQYSVTRWPTDVYIAADGTELGRSFSPQKTADYIALLERISMRNRDHLVMNGAAAPEQARVATRNEPPTPKAATVAASQTPNAFASAAPTPYIDPKTSNTFSTANSPLASSLGESAFSTPAPSAFQKPPAPPTASAPPVVASPQATATAQSTIAMPSAKTPVSTLFDQPDTSASMIENQYCVAPTIAGGQDIAMQSSSVDASIANPSIPVDQAQRKVTANVVSHPITSGQASGKGTLSVESIASQLQTGEASQAPAMSGFLPGYARRAVQLERRQRIFRSQTSRQDLLSGGCRKPRKVHGES